MKVSKTERVLYVVETPTGFIGKRRYSYKHGTTVASEDASFVAARLFSSFGEASKNTKVAPGWFVHRLYLKVEPKN